MRLIIVSGLSGSGKSVALNMLEDLDYYCVDNIPAGLLPGFIAYTVRTSEPTYRLHGGRRRCPQPRPRTSRTCRAWWRSCAAAASAASCCSCAPTNEALLRRFAETRRRHPLSRDGIGLHEAIEQERRLLEPIVERRGPDDRHLAHARARPARDGPGARGRARGHAGRPSCSSPSVSSTACRATRISCSTRARCRTPTGSRRCAGTDRTRRTGRDVPRRARGSRALARGHHRDSSSAGCRSLVRSNRSYLTVAIGCTGGQHRSVYLVEKLAAHFNGKYGQPLVRHRDLASRRHE